MMNNTLLDQFRNMDKLALFEINWSDYGLNDEWEIFTIQANEAGLFTNGYPMVEWDNTFSLDEHLQELFEIILEDKLNA